jgi:serine/threonine protein kinase
LHATLIKTPVEIHLRGEPFRAGLAFYRLRREVSILLKCRHPNIHLLVGFSKFADGPCLVLERVWGSVSAALNVEPFSAALARSVASQVASALCHLRSLKIYHSRIDTDAVLLVAPPALQPVTAKLGNFASARIVKDVFSSFFAADVRALIAFIYNLFATTAAERVLLDHTANDVNRPLPGAGVPEVVAKTTAAWTPDLADVASLLLRGWDGNMALVEIFDTFDSSQAGCPVAEPRRSPLAIQTVPPASQAALCARRNLFDEPSAETSDGKPSAKPSLDSYDPLPTGYYSL